MTQVKEVKAHLQQHGYALLRGFLCNEELDRLRIACAQLDLAYGQRNLLQTVPAVKAFLLSTKVQDLLSTIGYAGSAVARSLFFNKNAAHNWLVPWHQDKSIALRGRAETPGYGKWTVRDSVHQAEPPQDLLENMLTLRLHLDAADAANGALKLIPGSQADGKLTEQQTREAVKNKPAILCEAGTGDLLLMRPLLLHASDKAVAPGMRRIIHIELSRQDLPAPLQWAEDHTEERGYGLD
jgi:ectoine hydroxylase-related dioxygenase (phytanoyl-CoA dioxygenase family)